MMRPTARRCSQLTVVKTSGAEQMTTLRRQAASSSQHADAQAFPSWGLLALPPLLGKFRAEARASLKASDELKDYVSTTIVDTSPAVRVRSIIIGSRCPAYISRQLDHTGDLTTQCIVLDHELGRLTECAFQLRPKYGHRVSFVRCDAAFALWGVLPHNFADVLVFAMPVPHGSKQASHRRLLTRDIFHLCHPVLKCRESTADAKGIVSFSDSRPLAEFAAGQLDECKLLVPWARKKPDVFRRWLPDESDGWLSHIRLKGSVGSTLTDATTALHTLAAAKSGETTPHALKLAEGFDFHRRYYDALPNGSGVVAPDE